MKLNKYEKEILQASEKGKLKPIPRMRAEMRRMQKHAREDLRKDTRVNFRLSQMDFTGLRQRALREGIPYQTLLASIVHKFVTGTLIDRTR